MVTFIQATAGRVGAVTDEFPDTLAVLLGSQRETGGRFVARLAGNFPTLCPASVAAKAARRKVKRIWLAAVGSIEQFSIGAAEPDLFAALADLGDVASVRIRVDGVSGFVADIELNNVAHGSGGGCCCHQLVLMESQ